MRMLFRVAQVTMEAANSLIIMFIMGKATITVICAAFKNMCINYPRLRSTMA